VTNNLGKNGIPEAELMAGSALVG